MESWYQDLEPNALGNVNDNGYTNDDIAVQYILHFIQYSVVYTILDEPRLLLFDGHDSHKTERFITMAEEHNIILCTFPPHTTHLLQ